MKNYNKYFILLLFTLSSCGLFSTRDPESPDTDKSSFFPPTSASIVISNFSNAIKEKNAENYTSCFSDSAITSESRFIFVPSADAYSSYQAIFGNWDLSDESHSFYSTISNMSESVSPQLELINSRFDALLPDSAIYISDYYLVVNHNVQVLKTIFAGTLQFTLLRRTNGFWYIQKWIDTNPSVDTVGATWSILKAQFAN